MSETQVCEGVWRNRIGQRLVITPREASMSGPMWTDGTYYYADDGAFWGDPRRTADEDLVEYVGPLPDQSQSDQSAEIEQLRSANEHVASLERLLDEARNTISEERVSHVALEHHTDGMRAAFLAVIHALTGGWQR